MIDTSKLSSVYNKYNTKVLQDAIKRLAAQGGSTFAEALLEAVLKKDTPGLERIIRINTKNTDGMGWEAARDNSDFNFAMDTLKHLYDFAQRYNDKDTTDEVCPECNEVKPYIQYHSDIGRRCCDSCHDKLVKDVSNVPRSVLKGVLSAYGSPEIDGMDFNTDDDDVKV